MADKLPQSSATTYDPSIPPAEQPRRDRGRTCCCCLFGFLWKFLVFIVILFLLLILILWIIIQPRPFKFYVTEAKLTQFNYTNNILHYNLELKFTARNPNKKLNIYYDRVEGQAFYEGSRFAKTNVTTWLNSFRQFKKSSNRTTGVFSGQQVMSFDHDQLSDFNEDKRNGVFDIQLKLYFIIRFRLGDFIFNNPEFKPKAKCDIKVPLSGSNGTTVAKFEPTKCDVDF